MSVPWVREELQGVDLGDKRLEERLEEVVAALAQQPTASIPSACCGYAETAAAYRLFANPKTNFTNVLAAHERATLARLKGQEVVLLTADTTEIDLTRPQQQVAGAGPLASEVRRGVLVHLLHGFTPEGVALGTLWAQAWTRADAPPEMTAPQKRAARRAASIAEKESQRWVESLEQAQQAAQQLPDCHCVYLADSESDVYEVFVAGQRAAVAAQHTPRTGLDLVVRASQNRALKVEATATERHLRERALAEPVRFTNRIAVRERAAKVSCEKRARRTSRAAREAVVEVHSVAVTLRPPARPGLVKLPAVEVNVVLVREVDPPPGESPVEWLLVTTLPIVSEEDVRQVIRYYTARFLIEILFRVLKCGCRIEQRRFACVENLLPCLAVYLIVAWRTLHLVYLGRSFPELDCEAVFDPAEWKAVYVTVTRKPLPKQPPPLAEMIRLVAQLGGYINRTGAAPPGVQTLWQGLQRTHDLALA